MIGHYARNDIFSFAVNEAPQISATDICETERIEAPEAAALRVH